MADSITCICGYRGPSVPEGGFQVCPICRGRVRAAGGWPTPPTGGPAVADTPDDDADAAGPAADEPTSYRIPCPNGHVLKAREDMLGEQVCCPHCNEFFILRASDSIEFRRQQARRQAEAEARAARAWLERAIVAAVIIGLSFIAMLVIGLNPNLIRR
jgi:hypothetical protein